MRIRYGKVDLIVEKGDITDLNVDAIVNAANSLMVMGGGVAKAIKEKGGRIIEVEAVKKAPVPVGEAIVTTAGKLKAKYVIHAPTMEKPAESTTIEKIKLATEAALRKADEIGVNSIAFPALGAGIGGVEVCKAVKAMLSGIKEHVDEGTSLKTIILVAYGEKAFKQFIKAVDEFKLMVEEK